jgi:type IV secretion system protein VirB1
VVLFLELAVQCAPGIPVELIAAVASVESQFQPLALRLNGKLGRAPSAGEGVASVVGNADDGVAVAIGLTGQSEASLREAHVSVADAFDACSSLKVAASRLDTLLKLAEAGGASPGAAEKQALTSYFVSTSFRGWNAGGYVAHILEERSRLRPLLATLKVEGVKLPVAAGSGIVQAKTAVAGAADERRDGRIVPTAPADSAAGKRPSWDVFGALKESSVMVFDKAKEPKR